MSKSPIIGDSERFAAAITRVALPPEDRELSPYTGLTREHWVAVADDLLLSVARYRSPGGSRIDLPGEVSQQGIPTDGIEAFARTFLLAAFLWTGNEGRDPHGHLERYLQGVRAGTRAVGSSDPESWPVIGHIGRDGQPHVEAASIALSLNLTQSATWDRLSADEQDRVAAWLRAAIDREPSSNNWYLFPFTIASFLEAVGRGDEQTTYVIERGLELIERWYRGDGWYSDGEAQAFDHYIGWALHFYPLLHVRLSGDEDLGNRLRPRLREFLRTFSRTFDRNGAPLHQGRSLTYRMATLASVAMGEVEGCTPLEHGQSRRILSANLRYFLERGATEDGLLTLGWHGVHRPTIQRYSGPGSPYWASKGFAALMLPAAHPLWQSAELPLDGDAEDYVDVIGPIGWIVQATAADGIVRVHNHGSDHLKPHDADAGVPDPLYARFAYSTRTGPTVVHNPSDNDVQLETRGVWSSRRRIHAAGAGPDWVASWHAPRFTVYGPFDASESGVNGPVLPSARIESVTVARGSIEVRIHRFVDVPPRTPIRVSGWSIAAARIEDVSSVAADGSVTVERVGEEPLVSDLVGLVGLTKALSSRAPSGTAYGRWAMVPELRGETTGGALSTTTVVAAARLRADPGAPDLTELVGAGVEGSVVTIAWGTGASTTIDLDAIAWPVR